MAVENQNIWPKKITVDKGIVNILSKSTYSNFPRALKELITNSYDADALTVHIDVDLEQETVIISDSGRGMNAADFEFYLRIAGQHRKKGEENTTPLGRKTIGQFGVGFLSVFPFFKNYHIESKKRGTPKTLYANIPLSRYFASNKQIVDIGSILIEGGNIDRFEDVSKSYTKITLKGFNDLTKYFFYKQSSNKNDDVETYEGLRKLKWILADDLPIKYEDDRFNEIFDLSNIPQFDVIINNELPLRRSMYGNQILDTHKGEYEQIGKIKFKYCIASPRKAVKPFDARYLKIRNLNVGVGETREHFGIAHGSTRSRLHWLTGEVHIIDGMNDLITVARDNFSFSPDYEELKKFFNTKLNFFSNRLEEEAYLRNAVRDTGNDVRIKDVNLLNPENISKQLKKFEDIGFEIKPLSSSWNNDVKINEETKQIIVSSTDNFQKSIVVKGKTYFLGSDKWDPRSSNYPALKIDGEIVIVNSSYPLFAGKKFTDIFLKINLLLLINFKNNEIDKRTFDLLSEDLLNYFKDY